MRPHGRWLLLVGFGTALWFQAGRGARAEEPSGVKGKLYANADDVFFMYLNDQRVLWTKKGRTGEVTEIALKPGDIIKVRTVDAGDLLGFGMLFVSDDKRVILATDTTRWRQYEPKDRFRWWVMEPDKVDTWKVYKGIVQTLLAQQEAEAGVAGTTVIWGAYDDRTVYLFRVVSAEDLRAK